MADINNNENTGEAPKKYKKAPGFYGKELTEEQLQKKYGSSGIIVENSKK